MKKTLLAIILLLVALSLSIVLFVIGRDSVRSDSGNKEETQTQKYREETVETEKPSDDAISHDYKYVPEETEESEEESETTEENGEEGETTPEEENADKWYRVRKSAGDGASQIGAFKDVERAKALADSRKSEGYEVYDGNTCIYTP